MTRGAFPAGEVELEAVDLDDPDEYEYTPEATPPLPAAGPLRLDELAWRAAGRAHLDPACPVLRVTHPTHLPEPRSLSSADVAALHAAQRGEALADRICSCALGWGTSREEVQRAGAARLAELLGRDLTPAAWARTYARGVNGPDAPERALLAAAAARLRTELLAAADPTPLLRAGAVRALTLPLDVEPYATALTLHEQTFARLSAHWHEKERRAVLQRWSELALEDPTLPLHLAGERLLAEREAQGRHCTLAALAAIPGAAALLQRSCEDLVTLARSAPPALVVIHDLPLALERDPGLAVLCTSFELHHLPPQTQRSAAEPSHPAALVLPALCAPRPAPLHLVMSSFGLLDPGTPSTAAVVELAWALHVESLEHSGVSPDPALALRTAQDALAL